MNAEHVGHWFEEKRIADYVKHHFGFEIKKAEPIRGIIKLTSNMGTFVLKRVAASEKELWKMIAELAVHLGIRFPIPAPVPTKAGQLTFDGFQHKYVLLPWIPAKTVQLQNEEDWRQVTKQLAYLHQYSTSFRPVHAYRKLQRVGKWQADWKHAYRQLELYQRAAKWADEQTQTDQSWLKVAHYSMSMMENLLRYYEKIKGDQSCRETVERGKICHGNLHPSNMLLDHKRQFYLIDWNKAVFDVRTRDLAQWMLYAYYRTKSQELLATLLRAYQQISPLLEVEYALIYARFLYPERLVGVLRTIYEDQTLPITAGAPSILFASKVEEQKLGLMKIYPEMVQKEFGIHIPIIDWISKLNDK